MGNYRVNIGLYDGYELTGEELISNIMSYKDGNIDLLDKLVKANIKLVLSISNRYGNRKENARFKLTSKLLIAFIKPIQPTWNISSIFSFLLPYLLEIG